MTRPLLDELRRVAAEWLPPAADNEARLARLADALERLAADDAGPEHRRIVAWHHHVVLALRAPPAAVFDLLARDADPEVRWSVARHVRTPRRILETLRRDLDADVREVAELAAGLRADRLAFVVLALVAWPVLALVLACT